MGLDALRTAMARALTNPEFLVRLMGGDASAAHEAGLTADEAAAFLRLNRARLGVVGEGYVAKRHEPLLSAYPHVVPVLSRLRPNAMTAVLARIGNQAAQEALRTTLAVEPLEASLRRLLEDLCALDELLAPLVPMSLPSGRRLQPKTRLAPGPERLLLLCQGPLHQFLGDQMADGGTYPAAVHRFLVARQGAQIALHDLEADAALLAACDGTRTLAELELAHGPGTGSRLEAWREQGVLVDVGS